MRDLIILPSWLVVNPSPEPEVIEPEVIEPEVIEPEVIEPLWDPWFGDEERSDEVTQGCGACFDCCTGHPDECSVI